MRRRIPDVVVSTARSVVAFVAIVAGSVAIGALVGGMIWGQWVVGAAMAGFIGAWLALPSGPPVARGNIYYGVGGGDFGGGGF